MLSCALLALWLYATVFLYRRVFNQSASDNSHFFSSDQGSDTPITLKKHPPATVHALDASLTRKAWMF